MRKDRDATSTEAVLVRAWASLKREDRALVTREGEWLRVVFPGVRNHGPGPDFLRALVRTERGRLVRGDVELHQASSAWKAHGHQKDKRYNQVVLHVVSQDDDGCSTELASGARVPVLLLKPPPSEAAGHQQHPCGPCWEAAQRGPSGVEEVLEAQGWLRFQERVRSLMGRLQVADPDQALYEGLMEGLGYAQNRAPFRRLAAALPWNVLRREGAPDPKATEAGPLGLQALLLGAAGFLESGRGRPPLPLPSAALEGLRGRWGATGRAPVLGPEDWRMSGVRPGAHPWVRLAGAGALLSRCLPGGPAAYLFSLIPTLTEGGGIEVLRSALVISRAEAGVGLKAAPLGRGRADVLAVNVVLPFLMAWGRMAGEMSWEGGLARVYHTYPGLEPDGVVRLMARSLGLPLARLSACQQQGLHRLFRRYCLRARQGACPVSGLPGEASAQGEGRIDVQVPGGPMA